MKIHPLVLAWIIGAIIAWGIIDYLFMRAGGVGATISRIVEAANEHNFMISGLFAYGFAGLLMHLFVPNYEENPGGRIQLTKAVGFLMPVLALLIFLSLSDPDAKPLYTIQGSRKAFVVVEMIAFGAVGAIASYFLVPQGIPRVPVQSLFTH